LLKRWLRYAENLKATEDKNMVRACEPETGESLDDFENELRLVENLKNCHEGRDEIPICQEGNKLRSLRDLTDCQEESEGILHCQLGSERRSLWHLEDYQEGCGSISDC
jgi:hypothetical protein